MTKLIECQCCNENKREFKDYGCQHNICQDCHKKQKQQLKRDECMFCNPLQNKIAVNVSVRVAPIDNIIIRSNSSNDKIKKVIAHIFFSIICCACIMISGFIFFNYYLYFDKSKDEDEDPYDLNNFTLNKSIIGIVFLLCFIYILFGISLLVCNCRRDDEVVCPFIEKSFDCLYYYYNRLVNKICCINR